MKRTTISVCLAFFASWLNAAPVEVVPAESVGMSSERLENLKSRLQQELDNEVTGGIQVLISRRGQVVMYENLGYADIEENTPLTEDSLFRIYSMTKPIVGTAMMMLYEDGYFSMSDPVSMHIPEFADLKVYVGMDDDGEMILEDPAREPTIHDLMLHTAGFTYGVFSDTPVDRLYFSSGVFDPNNTIQAFIERVAGIPLLYQPGERQVYSVSVDIQGYLIEKWTGQELGEYLEETLFEPLGMDQTMPWVPPDKAHLLANIYSPGEDGGLVRNETSTATNHFSEPAYFSGGGQLISTSDDYWRFSQMLLNDGEFDGRRYLSPSSVEMMRTNRLSVPSGMSYVGAGFGLNVAVYDQPEEASYPVSAGEYFWAGIASTTFWIDPEEEMVVILLTQFLPFSDPYFRDLMHRLVHAAIVE